MTISSGDPSTSPPLEDRALAKKKSSSTAGEALREIEESGDRLADWAAEHAVLILGGIAAVLILAAAIGVYVQHASDLRDRAADELALATSQYRLAMGADPAGGSPIPEPANPELAARTRTEFAERFVELAREFPGTAAGAVAWLEAGKLQAELGELEEATRSFVAARDAAGPLAIAALASTRIAGLAEDRGEPAAAAEAYESAAGVEAYPLRAEALTEAARCWAEAGESDRALAAFQRFEAEFPDEVAAPEIAALIAEIRARG